MLVQNAYYRPAGPTNSAVVVLVERGEGFERSQGISPGFARRLAEEEGTSAKLRNELIAAAERYVLDAVSP